MKKGRLWRKREGSRAGDEGKFDNGQFCRIESLKKELIDAFSQEMNDPALRSNIMLKYKDISELSDLIVAEFQRTTANLDDRHFRQRRYELMTNLKRSSNVDLRRRVLSGEMSINKLVTAPTQELAPESLKQRRNEERRKYFEEQCLLRNLSSNSDGINTGEASKVAVPKVSDTDVVQSAVNIVDIAKTEDSSVETLREDGDEVQREFENNKRIKLDQNDRSYHLLPNVALSLSAPPSVLSIDILKDDITQRIKYTNVADEIKATLMHDIESAFQIV